MILTCLHSLLVAFRCRGVCVKRLFLAIPRLHKRRYNYRCLMFWFTRKKLSGIVFLFDRGEAFVIAAVGFLHALLAFVVHEEVYVCSARRKRMYRIALFPLQQTFIYG